MSKGNGPRDRLETPMHIAPNCWLLRSFARIGHLRAHWALSRALSTFARIGHFRAHWALSRALGTFARSRRFRALSGDLTLASLSLMTASVKSSLSSVYAHQKSTNGDGRGEGLGGRGRRAGGQARYSRQARRKVGSEACSWIFRLKAQRSTRNDRTRCTRREERWGLGATFGPSERRAHTNRAKGSGVRIKVNTTNC
eukprot:6186023-Pleurochrysis_carterae.AAC.1